MRTFNPSSLPNTTKTQNNHCLTITIKLKKTDYSDFKQQQEENKCVIHDQIMQPTINSVITNNL